MNPVDPTSRLKTGAGKEIVHECRGSRVVVERRRSPRRTPQESSVTVGRWSKDGDVVTAFAEVDNLSAGGAKVLMSAPPPVREMVWVRLDAPIRRRSVKATVLDVQPADGGRFWVRLGFRAPCPAYFYDALVHPDEL